MDGTFRLLQRLGNFLIQTAVVLDLVIENGTYRFRQFIEIELVREAEELVGQSTRREPVAQSHLIDVGFKSGQFSVQGGDQCSRLCSSDQLKQLRQFIARMRALCT